MSVKEKLPNLEDLYHELKISSDLSLADEASQAEIKIITT